MSHPFVEFDQSETNFYRKNNFFHRIEKCIEVFREYWKYPGFSENFFETLAPKFGTRGF